MKVLTILLSIHFLLISLLPNRNASELGRIPYLFNHYQEHCEETPLSFVDFLKLHYLDKKHHAEDHEKHEKLPFDYERTIAVHAVILFTFFRPIVYIVQTYSLERDILFYSFYPTFRLSYLLKSIWQPPKKPHVLA